MQEENKSSATSVDFKKQSDFLGFKADKAILKIFQAEETLVLSTQLFKYNDYQQRQQRNLVVTNKAVYNFKGKDMQRKVGFVKITGITIGLLGGQFVLHVPDEYDYRFASNDRRHIIVYWIVRMFCRLLGQKIPIFLKDEVCLTNYSTTKQDQKEKVNKTPTTGYQMMDEKMVQEMIIGHIQENENNKKRTMTLWSKQKNKNVTLQDFNIMQVLGGGAFGMVMLVEEKSTGQWHAMKSIQKQVILKKGQFQHTQTEKMVLEHVNHPYLVNLVYAFQDPARLYFVMQFMKGGELFQHLKNARRFEEKRAKFYAAQLSLGMGHLHSKGIVYRDLKLENILMDEQGNVYVSDFGMAKIMEENKLAMTFCGTPEYLSPQIIMGQGCDLTTDWWSLGILVFEMMYGLPPFYHQNQQQMFVYIKEAELKFPDRPETSKEAKDFISRCLNRDRTKRLGALQDVTEILEHPWFKDIDMGKLNKKQLTPPFKPKVTESEWIDNFDQDYTQLNPGFKQNQAQNFDVEKDPFQDF